MADDPSDVNTPPTDIDIDSIVAAAVSQQAGRGAQAMDTTTDGGAIQAIPFPFCLLYNGRPWHPITIAAPSPDLAAMTVSQIVQLLNDQLVRMGYAALCTAVPGTC